MRARTVFIILLVLIALIAFGPAIIALVSQETAEALSCQVDLNRVIPCVLTLITFLVSLRKRKQAGS